MVSTGRGRLAFLSALVLSIVLVTGIRSLDQDLPGYLIDIARDRVPAVPPGRGFLLEGLLGDGIGVGLAWAGLGRDLLRVGWWAGGLAILCWVVVGSVRTRVLSFPHLALLVAFSHVVDTLGLYVGKLDPLLLGLLIASTWPARGVAAFASALAALCNPLLALMSSAGVFAVGNALDGRRRWLPVLAASAAAAVDLAIVHRLFPVLVDRSGYVAAQLPALLRSAAAFGLPALLSAAVLPFLQIWFLSGRFRFGTGLGRAVLAVWAAGAALVACVLTYDHTRVLSLLCIAPCIAFLRRQGDPAPFEEATGRAWGMFAILFATRLLVPHIEGDGYLLNAWWP